MRNTLPEKTSNDVNNVIKINKSHHSPSPTPVTTANTPAIAASASQHQQKTTPISTSVSQQVAQLKRKHLNPVFQVIEDEKDLQHLCGTTRIGGVVQ